ncbi:MAG TPA: anion transporter [Stellaceae bacterium]|nr:anion transporter [Stellaceae bacterium]
MLLPALIFAATYIVVAIGRVPFFRLDRSGAALLGAAAMVASGTLTLEDAYRAIDLATITLLLGMMLIVAHLRLSGFFALVTDFAARHTRAPLTLLASVIAIAGVLSAFLVNDAVCLMLTPLVIETAKRLDRRPLPYLLALVMASNIGSVATITGNPQNMIIGNLSQLSYGSFAAALTPVALAGLVLVFGFVVAICPGDFLRPQLARTIALKPRVNRPLLATSLAATALAIAGFFFGIAPPEVAIVLGALLLLHPIKPQRVYREIDWSLLVLFVGLFIVLAGAEKALLTPALRSAVADAGLARVPVLTAIAAALSNLVSNVPAVLALAPFVGGIADPQRAWLVLAMASTFAGNFTILGSVANLIVVEQARRHRVTIGFWAYFRIGAPLCLATLALGAWWLGS